MQGPFYFPLLASLPEPLLLSGSYVHKTSVIFPSVSLTIDSALIMYAFLRTSLPKERRKNFLVASSLKSSFSM